MGYRSVLNEIMDFNSIMAFKAVMKVNYWIGMFERSSEISDVETDASVIDVLIEDREVADTPTLGLIQKLKMSLFGKVYIDTRKARNWNAPLPIYAFKCPEHGIQFSYPSGWNKALKCKECYSCNK